MTSNNQEDPSPAISLRPENANLEQLHAWGRDHLWMQGDRAVDLQAEDRYHLMVYGDGCYIYDIDGNRFIDGNASGFVKSVGHRRPEIAAAIADQLARLSYTPNSFGQATVPAIELARKLADLMPGSLNRTFFCSDGSRAVEIAIQIARQVQAIRGHARKFKIISRRPEYHGSTYATISLGARNDRNTALFEPLMPGALQVDAPHCHRCPWGQRDGSPANCCGHALTMFRQTVEAEGADTIAAFVATPFRVGGSPPPTDYWPQVRRLCDDHKIVLIADEVSLGLGRLGSWLAMERFGIVPDIAVLSKGLTSGELPVGAAIATREIAEAFDRAPRDLGQIQHGCTFGSHPVVMAAALENIRIIEREDLLANANAMGVRLYERMLDVRERHRSVEYVTGGLGLLTSLSIAQNRATGKRYPGGSGGPALTYLGQAVRNQGLSLRVNNTINITPPLVVTRSVIDEIVGILDRSLSLMEQEFPPA